MAIQEIAALFKTLLSEDTIRGISDASGADIPKTETAVKTALPELLKGLSKNCESKEGAGSLCTALDDHDGSILDNIVGAIKNGNVQTDGAKIIEHALGGKKAAVVNDIISKAGISQTQATGILQTVAPLVMESLGKTKQQQNLNADDIPGILTGLLNGQLDRNQDGDIKDDLLNMFINWIKNIFLKK